jgi:hypothetical protein
VAYWTRNVPVLLIPPATAAGSNETDFTVNLRESGPSLPPASRSGGEAPPEEAKAKPPPREAAAGPRGFALGDADRPEEQAVAQARGELDLLRLHPRRERRSARPGHLVALVVEGQDPALQRHGAAGVRAPATGRHDDEVPSAPVLIGVTLLLIAIAQIACYVPARFASRINPIETLRAD